MSIKKTVNIDLEELLELIGKYAVSKVPEIKGGGNIVVDYSFDVDKETYEIAAVNVTLTSDMEKQ